MIHDTNNKKCELWVFDPKVFPAVWLERCSCPDYNKIRAEQAESELKRLRDALTVIGIPNCGA